MATLLYEIGTEEMPAQYMPGILKTIRNWQKQNSRKPVFLLKKSASTERRAAWPLWLKALLTVRKI